MLEHIHTTTDLRLIIRSHQCPPHPHAKAFGYNKVHQMFVVLLQWYIYIYIFVAITRLHPTSELGQLGEVFIFIKQCRNNDIMSRKGEVQGSWSETKNTFERKYR